MQHDCKEKGDVFIIQKTIMSYLVVKNKNMQVMK